jgi:GH15 family glucan-1,4-alpha-glucosidase
MILETVFETSDGEVSITDFMPPHDSATFADRSHLVRLVRGLSGKVPMHMALVLRFGYGLTVPWVTRAADGRHCAIAGPSMAILRADAETRGVDLTTVADFEVAAGEQKAFVLTHQPSHLPPTDPIDPAAALARTERFWSGWNEKSRVTGAYAEAVRRSLLTLKALIFAPTGGIVAAPTTSLPEQPGGERNWDYRFCWVRDATLSLLALMNAGHYEEAGAWRDWLHRAVAGAPSDMQTMYGIGGERRLTEWTADWLPGYGGARPVRIGNAAHKQFQLDVYGELMDTFYQAAKGGVANTDTAWDLLLKLVEHVAEVWSQPDEGIWEVRGGRRHFTHSKAMAWVAIDRAVKCAEGFGLRAPVGELKALCGQIRDDIWKHGFDTTLGRFKRAYDDPSLDASLLLLAQVGFVQPDDPAYVATVEAIERELLVDGFVLRYRTETGGDGLPPGEGAFLACSFWLADAYAMIGREADARALFERLLAIRNDVGLLSEEYDPRTGTLVGNFPQAFSHIGLINTASNLTRAAKPIEQRSETPAAPG